MATRNILVSDLYDLGLPDNPELGVVEDDTQVSISGGHELRRMIFRYDGDTWSINYKAALPGGPDVQPWDGAITVMAVKMRREEETLIRWRPV